MVGAISTLMDRMGPAASGAGSDAAQQPQPTASGESAGGGGDGKAPATKMSALVEGAQWEESG